MEDFHVYRLSAMIGVGLAAGGRVANHKIEILEPLVISLPLSIKVLQKTTCGEWSQRTGLQRQNTDVDVAQFAVFSLACELGDIRKGLKLRIRGRRPKVGGARMFDNVTGRERIMVAIHANEDTRSEVYGSSCFAIDE